MPGQKPETNKLETYSADNGDNKEKSFYVEKLKHMYNALDLAKSRIAELGKEVKLRNEKLREISEAYQKIIEKSEPKDTELERLKDEIHSKNAIISGIKLKAEKYKKQAMSSNMQIESLFKDLKAKQEKILRFEKINKELGGKYDQMHEQFMQLRNKISEEKENSLRKISEHKKKLLMDSEREKSRIWHKERFLREQNENMKRAIAEKDRIITSKENQISRLERKLAGISSYLEINRTCEAPEFTGSGKRGGANTYIGLNKSEKNKEKEIKKASKSRPHEENQPYEQEIPNDGPVIEISETMPDTAGQILPIVKVAMQHGDSPETIKHSLISSGYKAEEVEKAIKKATK